MYIERERERERERVICYGNVTKKEEDGGRQLRCALRTVVVPS
jgi:hypothetical protein